MATSSSSRNQFRFATTRWSRIAALRDADSGGYRIGMGALIGDYWYPCYAYLRRRGLSRVDAEEMTQDFFASILEKGGLKKADPHRGRFRTYMVTSLRNHLANHVRREKAVKRGGKVKTISIDFEAAENRYAMEPLDLETPQELFDRRWALMLMENSLTRVREAYVKSGKVAVFDALKRYLAVNDQFSLGNVAQELGMSEAATRVALHRLRQRCRGMLRAEVARTLESNADLDSELETLIGWVGR